MKERKITTVIGATLVLGALVGFAAVSSTEKRDSTSKTSESTVVTNENGSVSRTFTECTVTTNGNFITERRRETRTSSDTNGNVLETSTSEYAQTYSIDDPVTVCKKSADKKDGKVAAKKDDAAGDTASFMGMKFGDEFKGKDLVRDPMEPTMLRGKFSPKKGLAGFDDYYVYVTPTTHKIVKVVACAKEMIEPNSNNWRRHYLLEALEKRYHTWARLCSFRKPCYAFDIGDNRYITACLADATPDYETVITACDEFQVSVADDEQRTIIDNARKEAEAKRGRRVSDALEVF